MSETEMQEQDRLLEENALRNLDSLYHTVNNLLIRLAIDGSVRIGDRATGEVMEVMARIDGGVYDGAWSPSCMLTQTKE